MEARFHLFAFYGAGGSFCGNPITCGVINDRQGCGLCLAAITGAVFLAYYLAGSGLGSFPFAPGVGMRFFATGCKAECQREGEEEDG
jgi:hypothetical protein